jgi:L-asparagine oxygenase
MDEPLKYALRASEAEALCQVARESLAARGSPAGDGFHDGLEQHLAKIPASLGKVIRDYRADEPSCALHVSGLHIDAVRCGRTPLSWQESLGDSRQEPEEAQLALLAALLGKPFAWQTIQQGRMVQNLMPVREDRAAQSGHGSVALDWHTEDGFHERRCRYLVMLGIRNPGDVPTTVGSVEDVRLPEHHRSVLRQRRFFIRPDPEHLRQLTATAPESESLRRAKQMDEHPEPVAILFGGQSGRYLRIDAPYTTPVPGDRPAAEALAAIVAELERGQQDVVVRAGDVLIVDNYRAVHGRRAFQPRFDGTDRWLKRISVSGHLATSALPGRAVGSRAI